MPSKPRADCLFHFTKSASNLLGILTNGFIFHHAREDVTWQNCQLREMHVPMVSFCDIPLSRVTEHTAKYGSYGIGLKKEWGYAYKLEPVFYATPYSQLYCVLRLFGHLLQLPQIQEVLTELDDNGLCKVEEFFSFTNVFSLTKPIRTSIQDCDFIQENEWRSYVHPIHPYIFDTTSLEEDIEQARSGIAEHKLFFSVNDIDFIIVPSQIHVYRFTRLLRKRLSLLDADAFYFLVSKIISLETIERNF